MSQQCGQCGEVVYRRVFMPILSQWLGKGKGSCGCWENYMGASARAASKTSSAFDIEFDHVNDEFGNKLHVHSIRELESAEKRLGFQSVVLHSDAQNFDDPPQQKRIDMAAMHNWKFSSEERYRERYGR